ncbi:hypothetical protein OSB04_021581 [Centaurea solstitialis]|uniref:Ycf2 N-terminal domain-containing protein n=1 Tax=Centaurea solstitialis TaxID=347529 RepID=A0AA38TE80_9ASTR|nr:hypothetical protein OSB04_021581 [Centaurea solstitialis]
MKYLLMVRASSSILVHGFSWLYGSSGGEIKLQEIVNDLIDTQMYNSLNRLIISLVYLLKENTWVLTITKKCSMPECNWGSSCNISNETISGIEILFKEKDLKFLEFFFVFYGDDPICKDHDWELFDHLITPLPLA